jgi:succinate dehydrogenase / fumarate reductase iron-sulfur subunit
MATRAASRTSASDSGANLPVVRSRARTVPEGRLPVSEVAFDRSGAASPFGDDILLPLPVSQLTYVHPTEDAPPLPM